MYSKNQVVDFIDAPISGSEPEHEIFTITPADAQELLKRRGENRNVSRAVVSRYARVMQDGRWYLNCQPIVFDEQGQLTDGQHRLEACVAAGVPFTTVVVKGVEKAAFASYDCGRSRNLGQLIGMGGKPNFNYTAAVVKAYMALKRGLRVYNHQNTGVVMSQAATFTNDEMIREYNAAEESYDLYGAKASALAHAMKKAPVSPTLAAAMWKYLVDDLGYDFAFVEAFFTNIFAPRPATQDRNIINAWDMIHGWAEKALRGVIVAPARKINYLIKGWNNYAQQRAVSSITLRDPDERMDFISAAQLYN